MCVLSPDLFSLYSEVIFRENEELHGVVINGRNVRYIRYADDTVLVAETKDLQHIFDKVIEGNESLGLSLNPKKTYSMTPSKKRSSPTGNLTANGIEIK